MISKGVFDGLRDSGESTGCRGGGVRGCVGHVGPSSDPIPRVSRFASSFNFQSVAKSRVAQEAVHVLAEGVLKSSRRRIVPCNATCLYRRSCDADRKDLEQRKGR